MMIPVLEDPLCGCVIGNAFISTCFAIGFIFQSSEKRHAGKVGMNRRIDEDTPYSSPSVASSHSVRTLRGIQAKGLESYPGRLLLLPI
jgi:hypothetical protein